MRPIAREVPPLVIAHRGAHGGGRAENSLAAIAHAVELKADGVEFDVCRLGDGTLVVSHDSHVGRGGSTARFSHLHAGDMAAWELLPLDHVLDLLRGSDVLVCLDWKQPVMDPALAGSLRAHRLMERTLVSSRAPAALADIKRQCPTLRIGLSVRRLNGEAHAWEADAVMVDHESGSAEAVRQLQDRGIGVYLWTVADGQAFEQVWGWRPDGIMSDALEDHLALRERLQSRRWSSSSSTGRSSRSPSG